MLRHITLCQQIEFAKKKKKKKKKRKEKKKKMEKDKKTEMFAMVSAVHGHVRSNGLLFDPGVHWDTMLGNDAWMRWARLIIERWG